MHLLLIGLLMLCFIDHFHRECLSTACETMRRQITLRAFNGCKLRLEVWSHWLSFITSIYMIFSNLSVRYHVQRFNQDKFKSVKTPESFLFPCYSHPVIIWLFFCLLNDPCCLWHNMGHCNWMSLTGLSYVRHLKTVRTHLLWLVHHNKVPSGENGMDFSQGLTEQVWRGLYHTGQVSHGF